MNRITLIVLYNRVWLENDIQYDAITTLQPKRSFRSSLSLSDLKMPSIKMAIRYVPKICKKPNTVGIRESSFSGCYRSKNICTNARKAFSTGTFCCSHNKDYLINAMHVFHKKHFSFPLFAHKQHFAAISENINFLM